MQLLNFILNQNFILASQLMANSNSQINDYGNYSSDIYTLETLVDTLEEAASYLQLLS